MTRPGANGEHPRALDRTPIEPGLCAALLDDLRPCTERVADAAAQPAGLLGPQARAWAVEAAAAATRLVAEANSDNPDLPIREIRRAAEDTWLRILGELAGEPADYSLSADHIDIIRSTAAREGHFGRMVEAIRLGHSYFMETLLGEVAKRKLWELVPVVVRIVTRWTDVLVDASITEYVRERERLLVGAEARRRRLIEALLAGEPVAPEACREHLGLDVGQHHLAMIIRHTSPTSGPTAEEALVRTSEWAARAVGALGTVVHQPSRHTVWLWASAPGTPEVDRLSTLDDALSKEGQRLAAGAVRPGLTGVRQSHRDALVADRLSSADIGRSSVVLYRDVDLAGLLGADLEQARRFVRDHLAGLADNSPEMAGLRTTLAGYYRAGMSLVGAAGPLHVHRNTVVYRLQRIEKILGRPVTERALELQCALQLTEHYGDKVLDGAG